MRGVVEDCLGVSKSLSDHAFRLVSVEEPVVLMSARVLLAYDLERVRRESLESVELAVVYLQPRCDLNPFHVFTVLSVLLRPSAPRLALKILPEAFAADPDRLARFQREAQVLV